MTAVLDVTAGTTPDGVPVSERLASWPARAGALSVDVLPGLAVIATMALGVRLGRLWWLFIAAAALTFVAMAVNRWLLPAVTGWTLGRALFGIAVKTGDGGSPGPFRLLARDMAHLTDTAALLVGWLWPLWDRRRRTFADLLVRTQVQRVERPKRDMRRLVGWVLLAATLACAAAVGLSYLTVYRPERAVDAARLEISEQGPRIVEQMLSYDAATLAQDFAHAQSLTTDAYRPQLVTQQQAVQKAGATTNEYWAVSSAVLSAARDHASMLMAMQGQRGADPKDIKFITATVRVDFDKSAGQWRVADLTVLKKPQMNAGGQ